MVGRQGGEGKKAVLKYKTNIFWNVNINEESCCLNAFVAQRPGPAPGPAPGHDPGHDPALPCLWGLSAPPPCITSLAIICDGMRQWSVTREKATKRKFPHWSAENQSQS